MAFPSHSYAIALGSNRPHGSHGRPTGVLRAALEALGRLGTIGAVSGMHHTPALGPAGRDFANAAAIIETDLEPTALLAALKDIERAFGRRPGMRWGARVLDLDIILWSGGAFRRRSLTIPHSQLPARAFVLAPLAEIAPGWRLPGTALSVRHLAYRVAR